MTEFWNIISGKVNQKNELSCGRCGSIRVKVTLMHPPESEDKTWIEVTCKKCGSLLYYDGA